MGRLIDADELYELIEKDFDGVCVYDVEPSEAVNDFQHIVDLAPTVDAENLITKHEDIGYEKGFRDGYAEALDVTDNAERCGHWIENDTTYSEVTRQTCTCSVCGRYSPRPLGEFCRWCGAKMDEVKK